MNAGKEQIQHRFTCKKVILARLLWGVGCVILTNKPLKLYLESECKYWSLVTAFPYLSTGMFDGVGVKW